MEIARVQERLASKALSQPNMPLDGLFRYVSNSAWLERAVVAVLSDAWASSAGPDGVTGCEFDDPVRVAAELSAELRAQSYQPQPVRRVVIGQPGVGQHAIGLSNIRDRVVREALRMVLEPILESHFVDASVGFRPRRRAMDAIHRITLWTNAQVKMWWVVVGTVDDCNDRIPHRKLLGITKRKYVRDRKVLDLLRPILSTGVQVGGGVSTPNRGVTQCGALAPLLANAYLHEMDLAWWERYGGLSAQEKTRRRSEGLGNVQLVRYGGDFLLLTNGDKEFAHALRAEFAQVLEELGLALTPESAHVRHVADGFDFLGFSIRRVSSQQSGKRMTLVSPTPANVREFKQRVQDLTGRGTLDVQPGVLFKQLNRISRQWGHYYRHANAGAIFDELSTYIHMRVYRWLRRKHSNVSARGSVGKFVVERYLRRRTFKGTSKSARTWVAHGQALRPMWLIRRRRYYIKNPGNPYIEPDEQGVPAYRPETPFVDLTWTGRTSQSKYARARAERLVEVGHRCEVCGSQEDLQAHHTAPQSLGGAQGKRNIRILCRACHIAEHVKEPDLETR